MLGCELCLPIIRQKKSSYSFVLDLKFHAYIQTSNLCLLLLTSNPAKPSEKSSAPISSTSSLCFILVIYDYCFGPTFLSCFPNTSFILVEMFHLFWGPIHPPFPSALFTLLSSWGQTLQRHPGGSELRECRDFIFLPKNLL